MNPRKEQLKRIMKARAHISVFISSMDLAVTSPTFAAADFAFAFALALHLALGSAAAGAVAASAVAPAQNGG